uniref:RNase H type-1 domain-containing protein n=1 Tax=Brassica oleracea TaxID=3712 RepID=A0A3P6DVU8_BRAOL|nr:unnamed protein product [Brassica oleracea]
MGKIQLMGSRNMRRREAALHSKLEAFGTDCKDLIAMIVDPKVWLNFSTELEVVQGHKDFKISYFPRTQNEIVDSLARNARSFHRFLCFIGCFIPVWLPRPPQV